MSLYDKFSAAVEPERAMGFGGVTALDAQGRFDNITDAVGKLLAFIAENIKPLVEEAGGIDLLIAEVEKFYRSYIAPLDIPGVPNLLEPAVDSAILRVIVRTVRRFYETLPEVKF